MEYRRFKLGHSEYFLEVVLSKKSRKAKYGDLIALYKNGKARVITQPTNSVVGIWNNGKVQINGIFTD